MLGPWHASAPRSRSGGSDGGLDGQNFLLFVLTCTLACASTATVVLVLGLAVTPLPSRQLILAERSLNTRCATNVSDFFALCSLHVLPYQQRRLCMRHLARSE
eukprot:725984-Prymnesium_polylepis.1